MLINTDSAELRCNWTDKTSKIASALKKHFEVVKKFFAWFLKQAKSVHLKRLSPRLNEAGLLKLLNKTGKERDIEEPLGTVIQSEDNHLNKVYNV